MTHRSLCLSSALLSFATLTLARPPAAHADATAPSAEIKRAHGYVHAGVGLIEVAHLQGGAFLTSRLTVDGMVAWAGVFGSRFGGGLTYAIGPASPGRPPRHALLIGARVMLDEKMTFDSHGDDASSYFVTPVGYGFLADNGFSLRIGVGPVFGRERQDGPPQNIRRAWYISGPFVTASAGFWF
jgi:hypothetical protein